MRKVRNRFGSVETLQGFRSNYWTPYVRRQKIDHNIGENIQWDEYYRAKTQGIYKFAQLSRIENKLNAYTVTDEEGMDFVNRFFVHNTEKLAGFRLIHIQLLELRKSSLYDSLYMREEREAHSVLLENLRWVCDVYLTWQAYRFREPLDNYAWIRDNYEFLASLLTRGIEEPGRYSLARNLLVHLQFLCSNIYKTGAVHKFRHVGSEIEEGAPVL